jgi:hypothetical protein
MFKNVSLPIISPYITTTQIHLKTLLLAYHLCCARVFVAAEASLLSSSLAMAISSDSTILTFAKYVTVCIQIL